MAGWQSFWMNGWAAGAALSKSLSDTGTVTDTSRRTVGHPAADTAAAADDPAKTFGRAGTDTSAVTDATAKGVAAAKSDVPSVIDSESETGDLAEHIGLGRSDTVTVSDSHRKDVRAVVLAEEPVSSTDSFAPTLQSTTITRSFSETATGTDAPAIALVLRLADTSAPLDTPEVRDTVLHMYPVVAPDDLTLTPVG